MAFFIVSYDLIKGKDYQRLYDECDELKAHKCLESVYLMDLAVTAEWLRNHLKNFTDDDDQLIVVEFSKRPRFDLLP